MAPDDRVKFDAEVREGSRQSLWLDSQLFLDHSQAIHEVIMSRAPDEVLEDLLNKPQGTFEDWFWARCRRLGIETEFRAKFEEWKRSRLT